MVTSGCVTLDMETFEQAADIASWGSPDYVKLRKTPRNPLSSQLSLVSQSGPKASPRTLQVMRQLALEDTYKKTPIKGLTELEAKIDAAPTAGMVYAFAELAFVEAKKFEGKFDDTHALDFYAASVAHAYAYLFDPRFDGIRNPYDPHFRASCELYNQSLEGALRIIDKQGELKPGFVYSFEAYGKEIELAIDVNGPWHDDDFDRFEFVSDYDVQGLNNEHQTFGLGVPLIAIRKTHEGETPAEEYYPSGLAFPVTAFLRVATDEIQRVAYEEKSPKQRFVLELCDPLTNTYVQVAGRRAPLESDISTPLAYYLNNPVLKSNTFATFALLNADLAEDFRGVYMMEPYDPQKIPVVLVHGLWSSPTTWMQMYNDLRAMPDVRENYQFWFYLYPSGQPFWISAKDMRKDLADVREKLDPQHAEPNLDRMVLVGHSMGGLVSRMQTIESGEDFWRIVSDKNFDELKADDAAKEELRRTLYFQPNASVRRVVTLGTPHRGSDYANNYTQLFSRIAFQLPSYLTNGGYKLNRDNPGFFKNTQLLTTSTSIDSLSPKSPIFPVMLKAKPAENVTYHNIVGRAPEEGWFGTISGTDGDGVVKLTSAKVDYASSEIEVPADHTGVHQHPEAILEVRRILMQHLGQMKSEQRRAWAYRTTPRSNQSEGVTLPAGYQEPPQVATEPIDGIQR